MVVRYAAIERICTDLQTGQLDRVLKLHEKRLLWVQPTPSAIEVSILDNHVQLLHSPGTKNICLHCISSKKLNRPAITYSESGKDTFLLQCLCHCLDMNCLHLTSQTGYCPVASLLGPAQDCLRHLKPLSRPKQFEIKAQSNFEWALDDMRVSRQDCGTFPVSTPQRTCAGRQQNCFKRITWRRA